MNRKTIASRLRTTLVAAPLAAACALAAYAQQDDPVVMTINGQDVLRSEFEYSYNKNNSDDVIDKKTVSEYVELFVNYKLKVAAAYEAQLDTASAFQKEFAMYRDQQVRPSFVTDADIVEEARSVYNRTAERIAGRDLIRPSHILMYLDQDATPELTAAAKVVADSIYNELMNGADFAEMATKHSGDPGSGMHGGLLGWIQPGQTLKEFEETAYALAIDEVSKPVLSPVGWHIIKVHERKQFESFEELKEDIIRFLETRNVRERIINQKLEQLVEQSDGQLTKDDILAQRTAELTAADPEMNNLIREYHDGLLLYEISNLMVWEKAANDEAGLKSHFSKNKKKYTWDTPRYKGMAYHVKNEADVKAVKDCVKGLAFDQWADKLRTTFNSDSTLRIRVEKGIFKEGDNGFIDKMVFHKDDAKVKEVKSFPIDAVHGKLLKKPESYEDVRGLVPADYQDVHEKQWVAELR